MYARAKPLISSTIAEWRAEKEYLLAQGMQLGLEGGTLAAERLGGTGKLAPQHRILGHQVIAQAAQLLLVSRVLWGYSRSLTGPASQERCSAEPHQQAPA